VRHRVDAGGVAMTTAAERIRDSQLIMQYPITLPTDYDMDIIRERVRTRGAALDDRAGLICKAYCIRETGVHASPVNQYAPFYLWADAAAAADFLWHGTGFDGIVRDFGRPTVRTWLPEIRVLGPAPANAVTHALLHTEPIAGDTDLVRAGTELTTRITARHRDDRVHLALGGIDPTTWQTVEFVTVTDPDQFAVTATAEIFDVLHISQPAPWS
jgi:hypothetical protein